MIAGRELDYTFGKRNGRVKRSCQKCNSTFMTYRCYVNRGQMKFCSEKCANIASRKVKGITIDDKRFILSSQGYYESSKGNGIKLHRYLWEKNNGKIPKGFLIHHINGDKTDNRIKNLELVKWGVHTSEHNKKRWKNGANIGKQRQSFVCKNKDCSRLPKAKGLCTMHYQRRRSALKALGIEV